MVTGVCQGTLTTCGQRPRDPDHKNIDMALLLKAEHLFERNSFIESAKAYDEIRLNKVPKKLGSSLLYKKAWSHSSKNITMAIKSFTAFIQDYPEFKNSQCFSKEHSTTKL